MSSKVSALVALCALAILFVSTALVRPLDRVPPGLTMAPGVDDGALFATVVARVRAGAPYYQTMGTELTRRNYPTNGIFNWRTPTLFRLMALAPPATYLPVLALLSLIALACTVFQINRLDGVEGILLGILAQVGALMAILAPANRYQAEGWAGLLIVLSVLLYARHAWQGGAMMGIAALFVRELAAPFCLVCVLLAARARRTRELAIWLAGGAAYAFFYWWHVTQVAAQIQAGDKALAGSWVQFGGLRFLMETIQQSNSALLLTPYLVSAVVMTLLAASLTAPTIPAHIQGTVAAYMLFLLVFGKSFNDYWGLIPAPTYAVALAYGPLGLRSLVSRAAGKSGGTAAGGAPSSGSRKTR